MGKWRLTKALMAEQDVPVHHCTYASQPDVQVHCTGAWDTPAWGPEAETATGIDSVYLSDGGILYTFTGELVTCPACKDSLSGEEASPG